MWATSGESLKNNNIAHTSQWKQEFLAPEQKANCYSEVLCAEERMAVRQSVLSCVAKKGVVFEGRSCVFSSSQVCPFLHPGSGTFANPLPWAWFEFYTVVLRSSHLCVASVQCLSRRNGPLYPESRRSRKGGRLHKHSQRRVHVFLCRPKCGHWPAIISQQKSLQRESRDYIALFMQLNWSLQSQDDSHLPQIQVNVRASLLPLLHKISLAKSMGEEASLKVNS